MSLRIVILFAFTILYTSGASIKENEQRKCGIRKIDGFLKSDQLDKSRTAGLGEFPWTVALFNKENSTQCAGSLIETNIVLTAAHCVKDVKKENLKIKAGLWDVNQNNIYEKYPVQERSVRQIIYHPEYTNQNKLIKNDIALIVLDKSFDLADHISLACLAPKEHEEKSKQCLVAGWGKESKDGKFPTILKKMTLPIVQKADCEKQFNEKAQPHDLTDKTICAGGDKASTCMGDGGAALVCQIEPITDNRYIQSGITSWGIGCSNDVPGIYTNVAKYREWIDEQIKKLGLDTKNYTA